MLSTLKVNNHLFVKFCLPIHSCHLLYPRDGRLWLTLLQAVMKRLHSPMPCGVHCRKLFFCGEPSLYRRKCSFTRTSAHAAYDKWPCLGVVLISEVSSCINVEPNYLFVLIDQATCSSIQLFMQLFQLFTTKSTVAESTVAWSSIMATTHMDVCGSSIMTRNGKRWPILCLLR